MAGKPYQSCLIPYVNEIIALRRKKPPVSYSRIASLLYEKYQITISNDGIREFVKRRAKNKSKTCKYAWDVELSELDNQPVTEAMVVEKPTALSKQSSVPDKPKQTKPEAELDVSQLPEITYSDTYNLTRLSDEEAAKWLKLIEERKK